MQTLKDELRHKILLESQHLFLERGYARTSLQMIADKVNISKSNMYHYFKSKQDLFYELTDNAADGLRSVVLRLRDKRFDPAVGMPEYQLLVDEAFIQLCLNEKYGLLLIMEQAQGTRYEGLKDTLIDILAAKTEPLLADDDDRELLAKIIVHNLIDGLIQILKSRVRPRGVRRSITLLVDYHTHGIGALMRR